MFDPYIKEWILTNRFRVYTIIAQQYYKRLEELKPKFFIKWLAFELKIEEEKINSHSLNSALFRQRQKLKKEKEQKLKHLSSKKVFVTTSTYPVNYKLQITRK